MANYYHEYKALHDSIKPIRGRSEEVRPIGDRRRDHERIEMDGDVVACRLYNTQVVRYYPDGTIGLQCGGWDSPLTADFIHEHSPWQCFKRHNKLWVMVPSEAEKYTYYPVPSGGELRFSHVDGYWRPEKEVIITKQVIDRDKAKANREPFKPFLQWAKAFMALSDGWIMHETRKQATGGSDYYRKFMNNEEVREAMLSGDDAKYLAALCNMLSYSQDAVDMRLVGTEIRKGEHYEFDVKLYDMRFQYKTLQREARKIIDRGADIYKYVQMKAGPILVTGVV